MRALAAAWTRFWFEPRSTATLALVRIAYGVLLTVWTLSIGRDLAAHYSSVGLLPEHGPVRPPWAILGLGDSLLVVRGLWIVLLVAALAIVVGAWTRTACLVAWIAVLSFQLRSPELLNSGDVLLRLIGAALVLAPAGTAMSVDRVRRSEPLWRFPRRAPWALRLVQVQVSVLYLATVWSKVRGETWNDGTALWYVWHLGELVRLRPPAFVVDSLLLVNLATYGTLAIELSLGMLIWNRTLRPWVLAAGIVLHLAIDATMVVGLFSYTVMVGYLAFVPSATAERFFERLRAPGGRLLSRLPAPPRRLLGAAAPTRTPTSSLRDVA